MECLDQWLAWCVADRVICAVLSEQLQWCMWHRLCLHGGLYNYKEVRKVKSYIIINTLYACCEWTEVDNVQNVYTVYKLLRNNSLSCTFSLPLHVYMHALNINIWTIAGQSVFNTYSGTRLNRHPWIKATSACITARNPWHCPKCVQNNPNKGHPYNYNAGQNFVPHGWPLYYRGVPRTVYTPCMHVHTSSIKAVIARRQYKNSWMNVIFMVLCSQVPKTRLHGCIYVGGW